MHLLTVIQHFGLGNFGAFAQHNSNLIVPGPYAEEEPQEDHLDRSLPQVK